MAHTEFADRIKETTTTTGTGTINLGGAVSGYQTFVAGIGNGHYTYYSIFHQSADEWEVGLGLITDAATDTLSRDTVISSSNGGSLVNFSAGTKDVICTMPAAKSVIIDGDSNISVTANMTATSFAGSGAALTSLNATNVASGTLADARLTGNVVLVSGATMTGNVAFPDSTFLKFGTSNDMAIYHDGSNSYVKDLGTGNLLLAGDQVIIKNAADSQSKAIFTTNGSVQLMYSGTEKFATATGGVTITGTATATTFSGSGASLTALNASNVSSGTLDSARLSGDVVLTSGATFTGNVALGDLDYILMGATGEYQIYHDHANGVSNIKDVDVGGKINIEADTIQLTGTTNVNSAYTLPTSDGTSGQVLTTNGAGALTFATPTVGDITGVTAGSGLTGGGTSGDVTLNVGAGTGVTVNADDIAIGQDVATSATPTFAGATFTANVSLGDDDYIRLGDSNEFTAVHEGSTGNTYLRHTSASPLYLRADKFRFTNSNLTEYFITANLNADVSLHYDNSVKFQTTSTGIQTTGTVNVNGAYTLPTADGTSGQALTTDGLGALSFTTITGTTINNNADNRVITGSATANTLNGESGLTYDGSTLAVTGAITATGDITAFYTSDETLKTNIANIENPMEKVAQLNGVYYNWTQEAQDKHEHLNGDKEIGVIAQQVEKVLPEMVSTRDDGTKAVRYERMCALLIECVKDLQNQVNELKGVK